MEPGTDGWQNVFVLLFYDEMPNLERTFWVKKEFDELLDAEISM